jgi:hypothetical protein
MAGRFAATRILPLRSPAENWPDWVDQDDDEA